MLGQHEHGDGRLGAADLGCRDETVVGITGGHPHVDDRDVGRVRAHLQAQIVGVDRTADDLMPGLDEQRGDSLT